MCKMLNTDAVRKKRWLGLEEATGAFLGFLGRRRRVVDHPASLGTGRLPG